MVLKGTDYNKEQLSNHQTSEDNQKSVEIKCNRDDVMWSGDKMHAEMM